MPMFTLNVNELSVAAASACVNQERKAPLPKKPGANPRRLPNPGKKDGNSLDTDRPSL